MAVAADRFRKIETHLLQSAEIKRQTAASCAGSISKAADVIAEAFLSGRKLLLCGNGGSAADCQHMAAEFVSRLSKDLDRRALPAIALTTDTSDVAIAVPSADTQYIQETHLAVEHILCELVEAVLFRDQGVLPAKQDSAGEDSR